MRRERKLLYHFFWFRENWAFILCELCNTTYISIALYCCFFLLLLLYIVEKLNVQNGINKARTNTQTNKKTNCTCNICASFAICTTLCRSFMQSVSLYVFAVRFSCYLGAAAALVGCMQFSFIIHSVLFVFFAVLNYEASNTSRTCSENYIKKVYTRTTVYCKCVCITLFIRPKVVTISTFSFSFFHNISAFIKTQRNKNYIHHFLWDIRRPLDFSVLFRFHQTKLHHTIYHKYQTIHKQNSFFLFIRFFLHCNFCGSSSTHFCNLHCWNKFEKRPVNIICWMNEERKKKKSQACWTHVCCINFRLDWLFRYDSFGFSYFAWIPNFLPIVWNENSMVFGRQKKRGDSSKNPFYFNEYYGYLHADM